MLYATRRRDGTRLGAVASLVPAGSRVADIGSGHGILARMLILSGRATHCIATEAGPQTLSHVRPLPPRSPHHAAFELRSGDGLSVLRPDDRIDVVVLAGMGTRSIERILAAGAPLDPGVRRLVLQPQTEWSRLRRWLTDNRFVIVDERLVHQSGRAYLVVAAEPRAAESRPGQRALTPPGRSL